MPNTVSPGRRAANARRPEPLAGGEVDALHPHGTIYTRFHIDNRDRFGLGYHRYSVRDIEDWSA